MLPKKHRIKRIEFPSQKTRGVSVHGEYTTLRFYNENKIAEKNNSTAKFSVVVSKKIAKKAIDRNLLKRRAYFSLKKITQNIKKPIVCVLYMKKGSFEQSYKNIKSDIEETFKKSKLLT